LKQQKKPKKIGRPPFRKGNAKTGYLRVRMTAEELKTLKAAARVNKQTVSEFVRCNLLATVEA
jgi:uncharacterized protein (DUF1778 family)